MQTTIQITDKFFIETATNADGLPCAKLVQNTPKAKHPTKTIKNYYFRTETRRAEWISETMSQIQKTETAKIERRKNAAEAVKSAQLAVGDIFVHSWGWEQTNINFYQVTKISGQTIVLQEVNQIRRYDGWASGYCMPIKDDFKGDENSLTKRIKCQPDGTPYITTEFGWCCLWDGREYSWTAYA